LAPIAFGFGGEGIERCPPELVQPGAERAKSVRIDAVDTASTVCMISDEAGLLEQFQMLGDGGPSDRQAFGDTADRQRTSGEAFDDAPSRRIAENIKRMLGVSHR